MSQVPGPRRVSVCCQQRQEGLLVGTGAPALSWGLGAEGGALWEEDAAEKSCPHGLCPHPAHHFRGGKAQLGEKVQPGFEQPRAGGSSSPTSSGSKELEGTLLPCGYNRFPVERLLCDPGIHAHPRTCGNLIWKRSLCRCDSRVSR